jgi:Spy/CpxP family protein refolding chaperone
MIRAIAMFVILAFASCVVAAGFMAAPASANKMDGKPGGGRNSAHYDNPTSKPPAKMKKPATAQ